MAITVIGDTHGDLQKLTALKLSRGDYALITGDASFLFFGTDEEYQSIEAINALPFTTLFVDGNHENFDLLNAYPISDWHGGKVHVITPKLIHLMRGQLYDIDGLRLFCFGGGVSVDKKYRVRGRSYWPQELPRAREYDEASENLRRAGYSVDYIITHAAPMSVTRAVLGRDKHPDELPLTNFLERLKQSCCFKRWYFGHLGVDAEFAGGLIGMSKYRRDLQSGQICLEDAPDSMYNTYINIMQAGGLYHGEENQICLSG